MIRDFSTLTPDRKEEELTRATCLLVGAVSDTALAESADWIEPVGSVVRAEIERRRRLEA